MEWSHNHSVQSLHLLSFKDISDSVIRRIEGMFARGLLPCTAHRELLRQLRSECNFQKVLSRGVPILFIVRDPSIGGVPILNGMAQLIQCIEFVKYIFAFVTQVAQSKDLVFLDSSSVYSSWWHTVFVVPFLWESL